MPVPTVGNNLKIFDKVRIDHFRGFVDFWQVPAGEETAINGKWQRAPAKDFFNRLLKKYPDVPIIAEDLGIITDEVRQTMKYFGFAGMKIFPYEVESVINQHPRVKESVVYGIEHAGFGELPCADIVVSDKNNKNPVLLRDEIRGYCSGHLVSYKVPKEFKFVSRLSRTYSGKIKRW